MKIMASSLTISWQIHGEKVETVTNFIFLGSKIMVDCDCSHEIKRHLLLGRKAMTNLDSILKNRDIPWLTKVCIVKAMVFPVVMYGCESWTIKKAEHWWINVFELWCWWRLLRVPWTARWSYQSILKEIRTEYTLKDRYWTWNSNTLTTWCEELTHWKRAWRKIEGRRRGQQRMRWLDGITVSMDMSLNFASRSWWWTGKPGLLQSLGSPKLDRLNWRLRKDCLIHVTG